MVVTFHHATLTTRRPLRLTWAGLAPAGTRQLPWRTDNVPNPLLVLDVRLKVLLANQTFCTDFHVSQAETTGKLFYSLGSEQWNIPALRELLEEVLPSRERVKDFEVTYEFPEIGRRTMLVNGRRIEDIAGGGPAMILLAIEDVTERAGRRISKGTFQQK